MDTTNAHRARSRTGGRTALAFAALVAMLAGCDPVVRPGDGKDADPVDPQGSGDIFDQAGNNSGGNPPKDCGGGPYVFSISASDVDPWLQLGEVGSNGLTQLWLWKASGNGLAAVAGDFDLQASTDPTTFVQFAAVAPNLAVAREGLPQVFVAVAGCEPGPVLLGQVTVYGRPETLRIRLAAKAPKSVAVDCCANKPGWPLVCDWFEGVLADTTGSGPG